MKTRISFDLIIEFDLLPIILVSFILLVDLSHVHLLSIGKKQLYFLAISFFVEDELKLQALQGVIGREVFL